MPELHMEKDFNVNLINEISSCLGYKWNLFSW